MSQKNGLLPIIYALNYKLLASLVTNTNVNMSQIYTRSCAIVYKNGKFIHERL